jgi:hypothetical protein
MCAFGRQVSMWLQIPSVAHTVAAVVIDEPYLCDAVNLLEHHFGLSIHEQLYHLQVLTRHELVQVI